MYFHTAALEDCNLCNICIQTDFEISNMTLLWLEEAINLKNGLKCQWRLDQG